MTTAEQTKQHRKMDDTLFADGGGLLTSMLLAAIVPLLCMHFFSFLHHTWPNFLYRRLTSWFDQQVATVEERVHPNRIIQDDLMIHSIMGYVSYCYVRTLQRGPNACDAVAEADYEYTFVFDKSEFFEEEWVPYSTHFHTLYGRVIASCMELSVIPTCGHSIQVEPGLFVRSALNKRLTGGGGDGNIEEPQSGSDSSQESSEDADGDTSSRAPAVALDRVDRLNNYLFYSMRKYTEDMDEHQEPCSGARVDEVYSEKGPFDPNANRAHGHNSKRRGAHHGSSESTFFDDSDHAPEERVIILEYRRPLPHERSQALCESKNLSDGIQSYDASRSAEDVMEGFLGRVHAWYLGHVAQTKTTALMVIYPSLRVTTAANGIVGADKPNRRSGDTSFSGKCYVLESAVPVGEEMTSSTNATAAVPRGASPTTTVAGGHIGLRYTKQSNRWRGKTFASLFFPGKKRVLSILDEFVEERGRFAVPGVASRITFFLHGAPGTGKTSFVKALARYLRRNLVVVSMSAIATVGELQSVLQPFDMETSTSEGQREDQNLFSVRPHQCVYVFEDFDAMGNAWEALKIRREQRMRLEEEQQQQRREGATSSSSNEGAGSKQSNCEKLPSMLPLSSADSRRRNSLGRGSDDDSDSDDSKGSEELLEKSDVYEQLDRNHITVERFIDLFNGLNLPDSFIAVFTTNHPEKIHPLIKSSAAMDVTLDLGMLDEECATEMVEHYYALELATQAVDEGSRGHLSASQLADLRAALRVFKEGSNGLSGALLEKMCIECNTVATLTARLRSVDSLDVVDVF